MSRAEDNTADTAEQGRVGDARNNPQGSGARKSPDRRTVPHGFDDFQSFQHFAGRLRNRMRERYPDLEMGFQGSAVTGRSADTGVPFDQNRRSDFDIAITGDSLYTTARASGVPFRGDEVSTGPLSPADLRVLGLDGIVRDASAEAGGRPVNVMIFRSIDDAADRRPTIKVWF